MKNKLYTLLALFIATTSASFGQIEITSKNSSSGSRVYGTYMFTNVCFLYPYKGESVDKENWQLSPLNAKFDVLAEKDEYVIIKFWEWNDLAKYQQYNKAQPTDIQPLIFAINRQDLLLCCTKYYKRAWSAEFGILSIPFKLRFSPFEFSKDISFDATAAAKYRISHTKENYISILGGVGITSVTLDSSSTFRVENSDTLFLSNTRSAAAFSFVAGIVFEFNKVQIGMFTGLDALGGNEAHMWRYQAVPFFAVGIGFSLFSISTPNDKSGSGGNK